MYGEPTVPDDTERNIVVARFGTIFAELPRALSHCLAQHHLTETLRQTLSFKQIPSDLHQLLQSSPRSDKLCVDTSGQRVHLGHTGQ